MAVSKGGVRTYAWPLVVVIAGLPGTGKSTLADAVAGFLHAPVFGWDRVMAPLKRHQVLTSLSYQAYLSLGFDLIRALVENQLRLGQSAVVDSLLDAETLHAWRAVVEKKNAELVVVECHCSDPVAHRDRLTGRRRDIPGWHEIDWSHVERMAERFPPLRAPDLRLDAMEPAESTLGRLRRFLETGPDRAS